MSAAPKNTGCLVRKLQTNCSTMKAVAACKLSRWNSRRNLQQFSRRTIGGSLRTSLSRPASGPLAPETATAALNRAIIQQQQVREHISAEKESIIYHHQSSWNSLAITGSAIMFAASVASVEHTARSMPMAATQAAEESSSSSSSSPFLTEQDAQEIRGNNCKDIDEDSLFAFDSDEELARTSSYTEAFRFQQSLSYHRSLLPIYKQEWQFMDDEREKTTTDPWPRNIPTAQQVPALEQDLQFYRQHAKILQEQGKAGEGAQNRMHDLQFRLATFYLTDPDKVQQQRGIKYVEELANEGHANGMCLYGA